MFSLASSLCHSEKFLKLIEAATFISLFLVSAASIYGETAVVKLIQACIIARHKVADTGIILVVPCTFQVNNECRRGRLKSAIVRATNSPLPFKGL